MDKVQLMARAWLLEAIETTGLKATQLAKGAGLAPSTLTRFLAATKDPEAPGIKHVISTRTLEAVASVARMQLPDMLKNIADPIPDGDVRRKEGYKVALGLLEALSPEDCTRWLEFGRNLASSKSN